MRRALVLGPFLALPLALAACGPVSVAEAERMAAAAAAARTRGVHSMVGFNYRRVPALALARQLIADGVSAGDFRAVPSAFVADVVAATMVRIQQRAVAGSTGLDDAAAYAALADLVLHGLDPRGKTGDPGRG